MVEKRLLLLLLPSVFVLGACSQTPGSVFASYEYTKKLVGTAQVTVREVSFANNEKKTAVTRVRVTDSTGPSMVAYDIPGYHPDILVGASATTKRIYREYKYHSDLSTFVDSICVKRAGSEDLCSDS